MRRPPTTEIVPGTPDASFLLRWVEAPSGWRFAWHRHREWELTWITAGHGVRFTGGTVQDFAPGDLCLLPPDLPHTWCSAPGSPPGRALVVQCADAALRRIADLPEGRAMRDLLARAGGGLRCAAPAEVCAVLADLHGRTGLACYAGIVAAFDRLAAAATLPLGCAGTPPPGPGERRLARIFAYVEANLGGGIDARCAAAVAGMPPASFSRFFRTATGRTFVDHLGRRRISAACRDLIETDDTVLAIALRWGWTGLSAFNRRFKALAGCTPQAYRRRARGTGTAPDPGP